MSYHWPEEQDWDRGFADFRAGEKSVVLGKYPSLSAEQGYLTSGSAPEYGLSDNIRQHLLQGLMYLPASVVGRPDLLDNMKRELKTDASFSWTDYAQMMAQVWRYPAPGHRSYIGCR